MLIKFKKAQTLRTSSGLNELPIIGLGLLMILLNPGTSSKSLASGYKKNPIPPSNIHPGRLKMGGAYEGKTRKGAGVKEAAYELLVRNIEGRNTSYLAILIQYQSDKPKMDEIDRVSVYRVDPGESTTEYDLTRFQKIDDDGYIGVKHTAPEYVLTYKNAEPVQFTLSPSNAKHTQNMSVISQGVIEFDGEFNQDRRWVEYTAGQYNMSKKGTGYYANVPPQNLLENDFKAKVPLQFPKDVGGQVGTHQFMERQPGLFSLRAVAREETGAVLGPPENAIVLFMMGRHHRSQLIVTWDTDLTKAGQTIRHPTVLEN